MQSIFLGSVMTLVATIDPQTVANTEKFSDVIDMSKQDQVIASALTGDMASETIDFKCYYCDSDGTNAVALKSATQLAASATANDNSQIIIAVKASELVAVTKRYVKFGLVTGGATGGMCSATVYGFPMRYGLATDQDLSTVKQIKQ